MDKERRGEREREGEREGEMGGQVRNSASPKRKIKTYKGKSLEEAREREGLRERTSGRGEGGR